MTNGRHYKVIKICTPFYREFETAKAFLRQLRSQCQEVSKREVYEGTFNGTDYTFYIQQAFGSLVHDARNMLVFGGSDSDIVDTYHSYFFLDSDVSLDVAGFVKLIESDKPITGGCYEKLDTGLAYAFDCDDLGRDIKQYPITDTGFKQVSWCGTGCVNVRAEVFKKQDPPWFYFPKIKRVLPDGTQDREIFSEDKNFCLQSRRAGFETWVDFGVKCFHKALKGYKPDWEW